MTPPCKPLARQADAPLGGRFNEPGGKRARNTRALAVVVKRIGLAGGRDTALLRLVLVVPRCRQTVTRREALLLKLDGAETFFRCHVQATALELVYCKV
jgi:hypothetical protein